MEKHYIALLKGINVGGHRKIKMAALKSVLESIPLNNVQTYIQSGNIVFSSEINTLAELSKLIENSIEKQFGFPVETLVIKADDFIELVEANPFFNSGIPEDKLHYTFLFEKPENLRLTTLKNKESKTERFSDGDGILYFCYLNGLGKAKLSNPIIERVLKTSATTRNHRTVQKLISMAKPS